MRSTSMKHGTVLAILATGALVAGCANDAAGNGGSPKLSSEGGAATASVSNPPPQLGPAALPTVAAAPVDPALATAAWKDGVALFDNGDYKGAADKLKTAVAGGSPSAYRHYLLGLALTRSGDREGAEAALVESSKIDATRPKTWINLARVRHERGDRTGALEAADKALELDPVSVDALHQRGRALMELNRGDEALQTLTKARELDATNGYVANTLGLLLIQLGRPQEAVQHLEAAKTSLPHIAYVRNNLGVAYERIGRLLEAKTEYLAAVDAGDPSGNAMRSLARLGTTGNDDSVSAVAAASEKSQ